MLAAIPTPGVIERAEKLLLYLSRIDPQRVLSDGVEFRALDRVAASWSLGDEDHHGVFSLMDELGWIVPLAGTLESTEGWAKLAADGWSRIAELTSSAPDSSQCFVAMKFKDRMLEQAFAQGIAPGIRDAGYDAFKVDEHHHADNIVFKIQAEIRRSRFLVADLTRQNNGVYFEAGYATGLGRPVLFTCHKDDFDKLHFDVKQINCLKWEGPDELRTNLRDRIEAVVGRGPRRVSR